jgi:hypothetical protein
MQQDGPDGLHVRQRAFRTSSRVLRISVVTRPGFVGVEVVGPRDHDLAGVRRYLQPVRLVGLVALVSVGRRHHQDREVAERQREVVELPHVGDRVELLARGRCRVERTKLLQ